MMDTGDSGLHSAGPQTPHDSMGPMAHGEGPSAFRVAAIDLGTVSSRLLLAVVRGGAIVESSKRTVITDLGEGVDATGRFSDGAVRRVLDACGGFMRDIAGFCPDRVCTTLTSAARDASNGERLLLELEALGLRPQVIPGEVEARLTFYGVAHDFGGQRIAVADSGGGSTELAVGAYRPGNPLSLDRVMSLDIGCRRVTERFWGAEVPSDAQLDKAASWVAPQFQTYWEQLDRRLDRLVAVGGTVTTLVALLERLAVYDSKLVHLHELSRAHVEDCIGLMRGLTAEEIGRLPGVQPKRAPVILAGAVVIRELMAAGGYDSLTVSENSLLAGMAATMYEVMAGEAPAIGWTPELSW